MLLLLLLLVPNLILVNFHLINVLATSLAASRLLLLLPLILVLVLWARVPSSGAVTQS